MKKNSRIIQKDWNMTAGRSKLQRARRLAMKVIYGDEESQYKMLWDYVKEDSFRVVGLSYLWMVALSKPDTKGSCLQQWAWILMTVFSH
jgi:hypothetical protein